MELKNLLNSEAEEAPISQSNRLNSPPFPSFPQTSTSPQYKSSGFGTLHYDSPVHTSPTAMQDWRSPTNGASMGPKGYDFVPTAIPFNAIKPQVSSQNINASLLTDDRREMRAAKLQGIPAVLKTIDRYKRKQIANEVTLREGGYPLYDFDQPVSLMSDAYEQPNQNWSALWKPEALEKLYPEMYIRDQKNSKDVKRRITEFRFHAENPPAEDEIWIARDIPLMHQQSCLTSKKNRNCMGCSPYWKCVQAIQEEIRPWGNYDLLHFEPEHPETFLGHIAMNGSFTPPQREMLGCDLANTMFYADDNNAVALWGLINPADVHKLTEDDILGMHFYDNKTFIDPQLISQKANTIYCVQRPGQTVIVPSGWVYFVVRMGKGLTFSASWNFLRLKNIAEARRQVELNRSLGIYRPINLSSLVSLAAYQKLDELESAETPNDRRDSANFLMRVLPVLKTLALEELLGEHVSISGVVVLSYDVLVDKLKKNGRTKFSVKVTEELLQVRDSPLLSTEGEVIDEDDESVYTCFLCKYILFNGRRSCTSCKYDLCETCYASAGKLHQHKMKRHSKNSVQKLIELVDTISDALHDSDFTKSSSPSVSYRMAPPAADNEYVPNNNNKTLKGDRESRMETRGSGSGNGSGSGSEDARDNKRRKRIGIPGTTTTASSLVLMEKKESGDSSGGLDNYDQEVIDCICGNNKDLGFMISCEKCYAWLHGKCVGISKRNEPEVYYCPRCVKKYTALHAVGKLSPKSFSPERKLREYKLA